MPCFFLGAGASKAFSYPVTKEFKDILATRLDEKFVKEGNLPEQEKILLVILKQKSYPDIEYVLDFWKRLLELKNKDEFKVLKDFFDSNRFGIEFQGIYTTGHTQGAELKSFFDYNESLIDYVTNLIYSTYSSKSETAEKSDRIYSSLLNLVHHNRIDVFTTNYDSVIELYCKNSDNCDLVDGFEYDNISEFKKWKPSSFHEVQAIDKKCLFLHKLHGSLNWKLHKKYGIVKLNVEKILKNDWEYADDLLIKPTLSPKEEEGNEPYKTLFTNFIDRLRQYPVCIVIGYSFRDRRVNEIFSNFLKQRKKLVIVSPSASVDFNNNFITKYNKGSDNCVFLEEELNLDDVDNLVEKIKSHI